MKSAFRLLTILFIAGFVLFSSCQKKEAPAEQCKLILKQTTFNPGKPIYVQFVAQSDFKQNAWVGIIPSNVAHGKEAVNDSYDVAYQYLNGKKSGQLVFIAPQTPGKYDIRMNSSDNAGIETATVSFTVEAPAEIAATISINKDEFAPGEQIMIRFTAPAFPENAWIGIIPSKVAHGTEAENDKYDIAYQYLKGKTSGMFKFIAPNKKGSYDFRMNSSDNNGKEVFSVSFVVK